MIARCKLDGIVEKDDSILITYKLKKGVFKRFERLLEKDGDYILDVKKARQKRSNAQNALLWELLTQIDECVNGTREPWSWYVSAIRQTGAKTKLIYMEDESFEELKEMCDWKGSHIRAVESLGKEGDLYIYRLFYGSSQLDTSEMSQLIDIVLDMASLVGLDRLYWEDLLNEG